MSKQVLILSSSPRKGGNSDLLCDKFMEGAKEAGNFTEKIFLKDKRINYCEGCGACYNEHTACPQQDDMKEILEKIINADAIVMASPVYFYSIAAQMKTLIDRCCAKYTQIKNKEFYFIMTAADGNKSCMERTLECFRGFTDCLDGAEEKGIIYGVGAWEKGDIKRSKFMEQAYEMGKAVL